MHPRHRACLHQLHQRQGPDYFGPVRIESALPRRHLVAQAVRVDSKDFLIAVPHFRRAAKMTTPREVSINIPKAASRFHYLHDRPVGPARHDDSLFFLKSHPPDSFSGLTKFAYQLTSLDAPDLDTSIAPTTQNSIVVKLQTRNTIIVRSQAMYRGIGSQ